jgi:hypothetical protein
MLLFNCRAAKEQKKAVKAAKKVQAPPKVISVVRLRCIEHCKSVYFSELCRMNIFVYVKIFGHGLV